MGEPGFGTCTRCGATNQVVLITVASAPRKDRPRLIDRLCRLCWKAGCEDGSIDGGAR